MLIKGLLEDLVIFLGFIDYHYSLMITPTIDKKFFRTIDKKPANWIQPKFQKSYILKTLILILLLFRKIH